MDLQTASEVLGKVSASSDSQEIWEAVGVAKEAMEFRTEKKPYHITRIPFSSLAAGKCPECGIVVRSDQNACDWCGQKLKWEDEDVDSDTRQT